MENPSPLVRIYSMRNYCASLHVTRHQAQIGNGPEAAGQATCSYSIAPDKIRSSAAAHPTRACCCLHRPTTGANRSSPLATPSAFPESKTKKVTRPSEPDPTAPPHPSIPVRKPGAASHRGAQSASSPGQRVGWSALQNAPHCRCPMRTRHWKPGALSVGPVAVALRPVTHRQTDRRCNKHGRGYRWALLGSFRQPAMSPLILLMI